MSTTEPRLNLIHKDLLNLLDLTYRLRMYYDNPICEEIEDTASWITEDIKVLLQAPLKAKALKTLVNIFKKSQSSGITAYKYTDEGFKAKFKHSDSGTLYQICIEPVDEDMAAELEYKGNVFNILIGCADENKIEFNDVEQIIAKANWFLSDEQIKLITMDMPDGLNCSMILGVKD